MRVILLGAPGSGKGTQSVLIQEEYGVPQVSTGDILRQAIAKETQVGLKAKEFVSSGAYVPDDVILELVRNRLDEADTEKGFILDGFPRTRAQAEGLDVIFEEKDISLTQAIRIVVSLESIVERVTSRRVCGECGAVYNLLSLPPKEEGICDRCGAKDLRQRPDDTEETVRGRLTTYEKLTAPLVDLYDARGQLAVVQGDKPVEEVFAEIRKILGESNG